jgi:serine/threonine-protein kinase
LISPALEQVVLRALAKDPALRFHSAREMSDELERVRRGLGVSQDTQQATAVIGAYAAGQATTVMGAGGTTQVMGAQPPPPPSPGPNRSAMPWLLALLLLLVAGVVGYVVYQQLEGGGTPQVVVPDVRGYTKKQAEQILRGAHLKSQFRQKASAAVTKGQVISTDPPQGAHVNKESTVTVLLSTGPKSVHLPKLRGQTLDAALATIDGLGLPTPKTVAEPSSLASGIVVSTKPKSGPVAPDTVVTIYYANGNVRVPNVVGMTCDQATQALKTSKLVANCTDSASDAPKGQVFDQSPSAGQEAPQQSTVNLQVSSGPAQVPVPDVTDTMYHDARKALKQAGLTAVPSPCLSSDPSIPDGTVVKTDPGPGTMVDPGSDVTVYVTDSTSTTPCPS